MTDFDSIDFFSDPSVVQNPYPHFEHLRGKCPVFREPYHGVVQPEDIANAVAWLVSNAAPYITGVTLPVDAGFINKR